MTLRERLKDDTTAAMRSGDALRRDVLRMVQNAIYNIDKAKHTLLDVIAGAEKSNPGFHAVSIIPEIENGAAQADVTLLKGSTSKQIDQPL